MSRIAQAGKGNGGMSEHNRVTEALAAVEPPRMSLWDIEAAWLELIQARAEAEELPAEMPVCLDCGGKGTYDALSIACPCTACGQTGRSQSERELAIAACDQAIQEYVAREVAKVDGIRAVVRTLKSAMDAAKQERDYQAKRAASCEAMVARIKDFVKTAMEAAGKKRIDGRTGHLDLKGNGGLEPLVITDPAMLPESCIDVSLTMPLSLWNDAVLAMQVEMRERLSRALFLNEEARETLTPSNARIRAALAEPCEACSGSGATGDFTIGFGGEPQEVSCFTCGGTGNAAVPGAHLEPRGAHVEIR